jgi:Cdc6-like AAA superfamily ATPase
MPIYTPCLRPDNHEDISLFVSRRETKQAFELINAFLNGGGTRRRLLVTGARGVGKSIGVRAVLRDLQEKRRDFFPIIVAGDRCTTVRHLLITIAEVLSQQVRILFAEDEDLIRQVSHLPDIMRPDQVTRGEFFKRGMEIEAKVETDYGLIGFIKVKLGLRGALSTEKSTEESVSIPIDDQFRIQLLADIFRNISQKKKRQPLLFIDNLDQIDEHDRIHEFLKYLLWLEELPIIVTVRSEFVSSDILREHKLPLRFGDLTREELMTILQKRIDVNCPNAEDLQSSDLLRIAEGLTKATGNPLAFLRWLEYLCWYTELGQDSMRDLTEGYVIAYHELVADKVRQLATWFFKGKRGYETRDMLKQGLNLDDYDLDTLERQGVLVPEDVTRPSSAKRYILSPLLGFLKLEV